MLKNLEKQISRKFRSILCLDGEGFGVSLLNHIDIPVIAADGAYNKLQKLGISPNVVIGDLDSAVISKNCKSLVIKIPDQNTCDFQKSLNYIIKNELYPSIVIGFNGGDFAHILNNLSILSQYSECIFIDKSTIGLILPEGEHDLTLFPYTKISIFGILESVVSSRGLKWELLNHKLFFWKSNSISNMTLEHEVHINVKKGQILCVFQNTLKKRNGQ